MSSAQRAASFNLRFVTPPLSPRENDPSCPSSPRKARGCIVFPLPLRCLLTPLPTPTKHFLALDGVTEAGTNFDDDYELDPPKQGRAAASDGDSNTSRQLSQSSLLAEQNLTSTPSSGSSKCALELEDPAAVSSGSSNEASLHVLNPLPLRLGISPLRPAQWTARGGMLSPPRVHQTPDRFIPNRRPPNVSRESFELSKPTDRLATQDRGARSPAPSPEPFGPRVRRSARMNEELQNLREAHSALVARTGLARRTANTNLRRSSVPETLRQISVGAVWNIGGPSAASDTIQGVANGQGGVFGSGTNAPLYTSMFLSRSDTYAELETYESRLALAFDVDRRDRVLGTPGSSSAPSTPSGPDTTSPNTGRTSVSTKHVWKDNEWVKEGSTLRLSTPSSANISRVD